jgi:glycosyltransferase involved in cell wall biosynthesis
MLAGNAGRRQVILAKRSLQLKISDTGLVSVIIPCYNQAHFLGEAISSVLAQTLRSYEIVVVDDGSADNTFETATRYPGVRCIRQKNQGLSAARNVGARESHGSYLVFLDADDRLLPSALEDGVQCLNLHPDCAFVYGHLKFIAADGSPLPTPAQVCVDKNHCLELLRTDYVWTPGVVMYRRAAFEWVIGFDTLIDACADTDLNIRISRDFPVYCHGNVILEYRRHATNMSDKSALMLRTALAANRSQLEYVRGNKQYEEAARYGKRAAQEYFGRHLVNEIRSHIASRSVSPAIRGMLTLLRYHPRGFIRVACKGLSRSGARARNRLRFF